MHGINKDVSLASLFVQLTVTSVQQIFGDLGRNEFTAVQSL